MPKVKKTADERAQELHHRRIRRTIQRQGWSTHWHTWVSDDGEDMGQVRCMEQVEGVWKNCVDAPYWFGTLDELGEWMEDQGYELKLDKEL